MGSLDNSEVSLFEPIIYYARLGHETVLIYPNRTKEATQGPLD